MTGRRLGGGGTVQLSVTDCEAGVERAVRIRVWGSMSSKDESMGKEERTSASVDELQYTSKK